MFRCVVITLFPYNLPLRDPVRTNREDAQAEVIHLKIRIPSVSVPLTRVSTTKRKIWRTRCSNTPSVTSLWIPLETCITLGRSVDGILYSFYSSVLVPCESRNSASEKFSARVYPCIPLYSISLVQIRCDDNLGFGYFLNERSAYLVVARGLSGCQCFTTLFSPSCASLSSNLKR